MGFYEDYVYELPKYDLPRDGAMANPVAIFKGTDSLPGSTVQMGFGVVTKEMTEGFPHFHHSKEENNQKINTPSEHLTLDSVQFKSMILVSIQPLHN